MDGVSQIKLGDGLTVVAGPHPPTPEGFRSERIQVLHWRLDHDYANDAPHSHDASDETYIVLEGAIELTVREERIRLLKDEALVVGTGVVHSLTGVEYPARRLTIRGPAIADKQLG